MKQNSQRNTTAILIFSIIAAVTAGCGARAETGNTADATKSAVASTPASTPAAVSPATPEMKTTVPSPESPDAEKQPAAKEQTQPANSAVTKAGFEKIEEGMPLAEVQELLGDEGMKVSTMVINGRESEIYKWSDDNFSSYIDVTFEKGRVVDKKEKGMK
jgi:hypothetical protein